MNSLAFADNQLVQSEIIDPMLIHASKSCYSWGLVNIRWDGEALRQQVNLCPSRVSIEDSEKNILETFRLDGQYTNSKTFYDDDRFQRQQVSKHGAHRQPTYRRERIFLTQDLGPQDKSITIDDSADENVGRLRRQLTSGNSVVIDFDKSSFLVCSMSVLNKENRVLQETLQLGQIQIADALFPRITAKLQYNPQLLLTGMELYFIDEIIPLTHDARVSLADSGVLARATIVDLSDNDLTQPVPITTAVKKMNLAEAMGQLDQHELEAQKYRDREKLEEDVPRSRIAIIILFNVGIAIIFITIWYARRTSNKV